jgi:hypothetical protein
MEECKHRYICVTVKHSICQVKPKKGYGIRKLTLQCKLCGIQETIISTVSNKGLKNVLPDD